MSITYKDYNSIDWSKLYQIDSSSKTGLSYKVYTYSGGRGERLAGYPGRQAGHIRPSCKVQVWKVHHVVDGKQKGFLVHRIIMCLLGHNLEGKVVDHINGDSLDNSVGNLRVVDTATNARNMRARTDSPYYMQGIHSSSKGGRNVSFVAQWIEDKKIRTKSFSVNKYGLMPAYKMAVETRLSKIKELQVLGHDYTERHLNQKDKL